MRIEVDGPPPIKNTAKSMRSEGHPHAKRVRALLDAMSTVRPEDRLADQQLSMVMHYEREPSKADALNLANGVADVIQRRGNPDGPWLIDDDHNIVEFHYTESISSHDRYWLEIRPLRSTVTPSSDLLAFALELADEADRVSMGFYRGELGTEAKADGSLVTLADKAVETRLRELILARYPEHAILGEEQGRTPGASGTRWIIDPIDGTHGFARGLPVWASLIAVEVDGRIEAGVASAPALGTRWWAGRGLGAYRGATGTRSHAGERIHVSPVARLDAAQVLYGSWRYNADRWPGFEGLLRSAWRTRGYGDFWQHCLVAEGAAEVALEGDISPWDIAALVVILEEAGGRLTDDRGVPTIDAGHCVTSNGALHEETLRVLLGGAATTGAGW